MHITRTVIALAAVVVLAPSGAAAASLYGGGTGAASVTIGADVSAGVSATGSPSSSAAGDDSSVPDAPSSGISGAVDISISANQVTTDRDLAAYEASVIEGDANVAKVRADGSKNVSVEYWHQGRLFGLFPVKVRSQTSAALAADGSAHVSTRMPWWSVFVAGTGSAGARIDEELSASSRVAADLKMATDAAARARLIEAIVEAHADASVAAASRN